MNSFIEDIEKLRLYNFPNKAYIEIIPQSHKKHPVENSLSSIYIRGIYEDKGTIINISHPDLLELGYNEVINKIKQIEEIYTINSKELFHYFYHPKCHDQLFYHPEFKKYITETHYYFLNKNFNNINEIIPIVKHYESCEENFKELKRLGFQEENFIYLNKISKIFNVIEKNGIKTDPALFEKYFNKKNKGKAYTQYNLYTTTSRPYNKFGGINYAALKKDNGERKCFIASNDFFMEVDISAYHPLLISRLLNYSFPDDDIHQYFADLYKVSYEKAKQITFQQTYGKIRKEYKHLEFFEKLDKFTSKLWEEFNKNGFITCPASNKKFYKDELEDMNPSKLINYLCQNLETSTNVYILEKIFKLLKNKNTKIVLYSFDAFLFDVDKTEKETMKQILNIFKELNFSIKLKKGPNYDFR